MSHQNIWSLGIRYLIKIILISTFFITILGFSIYKAYYVSEQKTKQVSIYQYSLFRREYITRISQVQKLQYSKLLTKVKIDLIWFLVFNATFSKHFSYILVISFSGGRSRSSRREPPNMGKQLANFITCDCESSAPFFVIYKAGHKLTPYWWQACMSC